MSKICNAMYARGGKSTTQRARIEIQHVQLYYVSLNVVGILLYCPSCSISSGLACDMLGTSCKGAIRSRETGQSK